MSLPPEAVQQLEYLDALRTEQEAVILAGKFTAIEEYRAACTVIRNWKRLRENLLKIYAGAMAADLAAEESLDEFHNPKDKI